MLNKKKFIVKCNDGYIYYNKPSNNYYPNAAFRTLVEPPKIIDSNSLYKYAICRYMHMTAKKFHPKNLSGQPARHQYRKWKRIKYYTTTKFIPKYKTDVFNAKELIDLMSIIKKRVFKIRTESNSGNFSDWFYYYYNSFNNTFNRIDKYRDRLKRNNHAADTPQTESVQL